MNNINETGGWSDIKAAKKYFGVGRSTIEKIATAANAKRKIGRRAIYSIRLMDAWLEGGETNETLG